MKAGTGRVGHSPNGARRPRRRAAPVKNSDEVPAAVSRRSHLTTSVTAPVAAAVGAKGLVAVAQDLAARSAGDVVVLDRVTRHVNDLFAEDEVLATAASFSILTRIKSAWSANEKLTAKGLDHVNSLAGHRGRPRRRGRRASADRRGGGLRAVLPRFTSFGDVALRAGSDGSEGLRAGAEAQRLPVAPRDDRAHLVPVTAVRDPGANKGHGRRRHPRDGGAPGLGMNLAAASAGRERRRGVSRAVGVSRPSVPVEPAHNRTPVDTAPGVRRLGWHLARRRRRRRGGRTA